MNTAHLVRAFRPVSPESLHDLEAFNTAPHTFPRHAIRGRAVLGASIVSLHESRARNDLKYNAQPTQSLRSVFYPYPESATEPLTLEVKDIAFLGHHLWRRSLALILDDPTDTLLAEREEYLRRMKKTIAQHVTPHVSVLDFDPTHATNEVIEWAHSVAPSAITLDAVTTYPQLTPPTPKKVHVPKASAPKTQTQYKPDYSKSVIRTIGNQPPIPNGLLQATRQHYTETPLSDSL